MNLFLTERYEELIAQALSDNRLHNQAKECCQIMVSAVRVRMGESITKADGSLAKGWHDSHVMCRWAASSGQAYRLLFDVAVHCLREHHYRFGTASELTVQLKQLRNYRYSIENLDNPQYCLCLPEPYIIAAGSKFTEDIEVAIKLYRHYCYHNKMMHLANYTRRPLPPWLSEPKKIRYVWCSEGVPPEW